MPSPRVRGRLFVSIGVVLAALGACGGDQRGERRPEAARPPGPAVVAPAEDESARPKIVALGDSLTAGLGLPEEQAYPSLLQQKIDAEGYQFEVENAGVSGDTSAGGLRRLDWALDGDVRVLIVALGANDGLRGLPVAEMKANLTEIVRRAKRRGIAVVLAGMEAPPNYGQEYTEAFRAAYRDLAREEDLVFVPFLLEDVAGESALNQADGIHPNAQGARIIADTLWSVLKPLLDRMSTAP